MNITHVEETAVNGDKLVAIFNRQKELMTKYHDIEERSGLLQTSDCPVNLDDKKGQARLKDFAWRITEEVGEAIDAKMDNDILHFKEELIDGLHFLTEFSILAGFTPSMLVPDEQVVEGKEDRLDAICDMYKGSLMKDADLFYYRDHIRFLGMTCNCLKNKPWKQSMMMTDKDNFYKHFSCVWENYISLLTIYMDSVEIYQTYFKKSEVNKFRQRSNY